MDFALRYLHSASSMGYYATYYTFGLPTFVVIVVALYLLFTGIWDEIPSFGGTRLILDMSRFG